MLCLRKRHICSGKTPDPHSKVHIPQLLNVARFLQVCKCQVSKITIKKFPNPLRIEGKIKGLTGYPEQKNSLPLEISAEAMYCMAWIMVR
jgi:hypothetical protein